MRYHSRKVVGSLVGIEGRALARYGKIMYLFEY